MGLSFNEGLSEQGTGGETGASSLPTLLPHSLWLLRLGLSWTLMLTKEPTFLLGVDLWISLQRGPQVLLFTLDHPLCTKQVIDSGLVFYNTSISPQLANLLASQVAQFLKSMCQFMFGCFVSNFQ